MPSTRFNLQDFVLGDSTGNPARLTENLELYDALSNIAFKSITLQVQPASLILNDSGNVWYVPVGSSGTEWSQNIGKIAVWTFNGGWFFFDIFEGISGWVIDESKHRAYDGANWIDTEFVKRNVLVIPYPVAAPGKAYYIIRALSNIEIVYARYDVIKRTSDVTPVTATLQLSKQSGLGGTPSNIVPGWTLDVNGGFETTVLSTVAQGQLVGVVVNATTGTPEAISVTIEYLENA